MEIVGYITYVVLVVLHLVGLASLLGGFLNQMKAIAAGQGKIVAGILHGAYIMLATGLLLILLGLIDGHTPNAAKMITKAVVLVVILGIALKERKTEPAPKWSLYAIGGLSVLNIVLAVAWS